MSVQIDPSDCAYCSHYCEENIYHLANKFLYEFQQHTSFVVFVSSTSKATPIWHQKLCDSEHNPVVWDYHVFLVLKTNCTPSSECASSSDARAHVYDFDSRLPFPVSAMRYISECIRPQFPLPECHKQVWFIQTRPFSYS